MMALSPSTHLPPEPGWCQLPCRGAPGCVWGFRVQEVCLKCSGSGILETAGFIHDDPGVLPGDLPCLEGIQSRGQGTGQRMCLPQQSGCGPFPNGQHAGDFRYQAHFTR